MAPASVTHQTQAGKEVLADQVRAALDAFEKATEITDDDEEHIHSQQSLVSEKFEMLIQASVRLLSAVSSTGADLRVLRRFPRGLARKAFLLCNIAFRPKLLECERLRIRVKELATLHNTSNRRYLEELSVLRSRLRKAEVGSVGFEHEDQYLWDALETLPEDFRGLAADVLIEKLRCFVSQSYGTTLSELQSTMRSMSERLQQLETEKAEFNSRVVDAQNANKELETRLSLMNTKYEDVERSNMINSGSIARCRHIEEQAHLEQARNTVLQQEVRDLRELLGGGEVRTLEEELAKSRRKCAELQHHYNYHEKRADIGKDLNFSALDSADAKVLLKLDVPNFASMVAWALNDNRVSEWLLRVAEKVLLEFEGCKDTSEMEVVRRAAAERRLKNLRQSVSAQRKQSMFFQKRETLCGRQTVFASAENQDTRRLTTVTPPQSATTPPQGAATPLQNATTPTESTATLPQVAAIPEQSTATPPVRKAPRSTISEGSRNAPRITIQRESSAASMERHASAEFGWRSTGRRSTVQSLASEDEDSDSADEQVVQEAVMASPAFRFLLEQMGDRRGNIRGTLAAPGPIEQGVAGSAEQGAAASTEEGAATSFEQGAPEPTEPGAGSVAPGAVQLETDTAEMDADDMEDGNMAALTLKKLISDHVLLEREHRVAVSQLAEWRTRAITDGNKLTETTQALELATTSLLHPSKVAHIETELRKLKLEHQALKNSNQLLTSSLEAMRKRVLELEKLKDAVPSEFSHLERIKQIMASCDRKVFNRLYEDALRREQRDAVLVKGLRVPRLAVQQLARSFSAPCSLTELRPIEAIDDMVLQNASYLAESKGKPIFNEPLMLSAEFPGKSRKGALRPSSPAPAAQRAAQPPGVDDRAGSKPKPRRPVEGGDEVERIGSLVVRRPTTPCSKYQCSPPASQRSTSVGSALRSLASSPATAAASGPMSARTTPGPGSRADSPMDYAVPAHPHSARAAKPSTRKASHLEMQARARPKSAGDGTQPTLSDIVIPGGRPKSAGSVGQHKRRPMGRLQPAKHAAPAGPTVAAALDALNDALHATYM